MTGGDHFLTPVQAPSNIEWGGGRGRGGRERERVIESYEKKIKKWKSVLRLLPLIVVNPLTPISDKHVPSPYNIHTSSSQHVMRILKLIR